MRKLTCRICGNEKDASEFLRRKDSKTGHRSECDDCRRSYKRNLRLSDVDRYRQEDNRRNKAIRLAAFMMLGGRCARCGIGDYRVLHLDHKYGGGTALRRNGEHHRDIERGIVAGALDLNLYQILCANCHMIKTYHDD